MKQILFLFCLSASFASAQSYGEAVSYQDRHRDYTHEMLQTMRDYDNHKERSEYVYESSGNNKKVREWVDMGSIEKDSIDKMYNHSWIDLPETPLEDGIYKASIFCYMYNKSRLLRHIDLCDVTIVKGSVMNIYFSPSYSVDCSAIVDADNLATIKRRDNLFLVQIYKSH